VAPHRKQLYSIVEIEEFYVDVVMGECILCILNVKVLRSGGTKIGEPANPQSDIYIPDNSGEMEEQCRTVGCCVYLSPGREKDVLGHGSSYCCQECEDMKGPNPRCSCED
jgi:hypothetical protein